MSICGPARMSALRPIKRPFHAVTAIMKQPVLNRQMLDGMQHASHATPPDASVSINPLVALEPVVAFQ